MPSFWTSYSKLNFQFFNTGTLKPQLYFTTLLFLLDSLSNTFSLGEWWEFKKHSKSIKKWCNHIQILAILLWEYCHENMTWVLVVIDMTWVIVLFLFWMTWTCSIGLWNAPHLHSKIIISALHVKEPHKKTKATSWSHILCCGFPCFTLAAVSVECFVPVVGSPV